MPLMVSLFFSNRYPTNCSKSLLLLTLNCAVCELTPVNVTMNADFLIFFSISPCGFLIIILFIGVKIDNIIKVCN